MNYDDALHNCIFRYISGSKSYGTDTPESDEDIRGVFITPLVNNFELFKTHFVGHGTIREHLTCAVTAIEEYQYNTAIERLRLAQRTDEGDLDIAVGTVHKPNCDEELQELRKFLKLASENNPNILEALYVDRLILQETETWKYIKKHRDLFLSKKSRYTFSGYATAQFRKILTHRQYLLNPPKKKPCRADFNLSESSIIPKIQLNAILTIGDEYLVGSIKEVVHNEKRYYDALKSWNSHKRWEENRNPKRKILEEKFGYDAKHAMQLVRIARQSKEILTDKYVHVYRPDREELKAIRNGAWKFEDLLKFIEGLDNELDDLYKQSDLRDTPDHIGISELYKEICRRHYGVLI